MRKVFHDSILEQLFTEEGYVTLPLLSADEIDHLLEFCEKTEEKSASSPFTHTHYLDDDGRQVVHHTVTSTLKETVQNLLINYDPVYGFILIKRSGPEGVIRVHQDMTLVDENFFRGLTVWCALSDTTISNGCFHIVKRSHLFINNIRGANDIPMPYEQIKDEIEAEFVEPVPLRAGEAIIFDHRLWHFSPTNDTDKPRIAAACIFLPFEAEMCHYSLTGNGRIAQFHVPRDFALNYQVGSTTHDDYTLVDNDFSQVAEMDIRTFKRIYQKHNPKKPTIKSMLDKACSRLKAF